MKFLKALKTFWAFYKQLGGPLTPDEEIDRQTYSM
jgi:hypothetical protein